ncbi:MAG: Gfo/Idh/MocA family oxidoreductase [Thermoguttaceae bacterium]|jgi:predicted dehydrogenase|nr:Gfo/Idh/MocA family oxidoreductase [Thermoguttaceae bacterium]
MTRRTTRRRFLGSAVSAGLGAWIWRGSRQTAVAGSANEKLNVGVVGTGGRGRSNLNGVARTENIVALCDVDQRRLAKAAEQHPGARQYADFRRMLEQNNIDAVVVSTPDHTHAPIALAAMELGKHVYCEKPLAASVSDARAMAEAAARTGVVTQMGNQVHASDHLRKVVELLQAGVLGRVEKVVTFCHKVLRHSGGELPADTPPVPEYLDWNLWLGPVPERPYHPAYHPGGWRVFWGFGSGNFADMGCHILDAPYWGLNLRHPIHIATEGPPPHPHVAPKQLIVRYQFERAEGGTPLEVSWHDGEAAPAGEIVEGINDGVLIVGERGRLTYNFRGGATQLLPAEAFEGFKPPEPTLPRPANHYVEWAEACKGRGQTASSFQYGAALTEMIMAGVVAYRMGRPLKWDGPNMQTTDCPEAEALIRPPRREGWG